MEKEIEIIPQSICVHGDNLRVLEFVKNKRNLRKGRNFNRASFKYSIKVWWCMEGIKIIQSSENLFY